MREGQCTMHLHRRNLDREEHQETRELVKSAFGLARALGIKTLVVQADEISDRRLVEQVRDDERVIWVARERKQMPVHSPRQGREGARIGAIFVLGDRRTLSPHLRQLMLNPLKGHAQAARSIHNPDLLETLRELAAMDGAFVVSRRGVVDSAGTYLDAPVGRGRLRPGLGARPAAALAITTVTDATAIVISTSSGTVSVYDGGETALELEQAHLGS